jgi:hypothetical protein
MLKMRVVPAGSLATDNQQECHASVTIQLSSRACEKFAQADRNVFRVD